MPAIDYFRPKEIVWAKVDSYPWWPGKIIRKFQQNSTTVYKISFFCDPSYIYLHAQQLLHHSEFDESLNAAFVLDSKLKKAISMANASLQKQKSSDRTTDEEIVSPIEQNIIQVARDAEIVSQPLEEVEAECKSADFEFQQVGSDLNLAEILDIEVTCDNVVNLLESHLTSLQKSSYCYSNRKQAMKFKLKLRQTLLHKYRLDDLHRNLPQADRANSLCDKLCDDSFNNSLLSQNIFQNSSLIQKYILQNDKSSNLKKQNKLTYDQFQRKSFFSKADCLQHLKVVCTRKLSSFLRWSGMTHQQSKFKSIEIVNQIIDITQGNLSKTKKGFKDLMVSLKNDKITSDDHWQPVFFEHYLKEIKAKSKTHNPLTNSHSF